MHFYSSFFNIKHVLKVIRIILSLIISILLFDNINIIVNHLGTIFNFFYIYDKIIYEKKKFLNQNITSLENG